MGRTHLANTKVWPYRFVILARRQKHESAVFDVIGHWLTLWLGRTLS